MKRMIAVIGMLLLSPYLRAASSGRTGANFLEIPVGARAASLGSSYAALSTDAYAPAWNPSGLGMLTQNQIALQHISYLDSVRYEFGSIAFPVFGQAGFAVSVRDFHSGKIPGFDISGNSISDFSAHYGAYSVSYGQAVTPGLLMGLTGSLLAAKLQEVSATVYSFDVGAMYRPSDIFSVGLVGANLGDKLKFLEMGDKLPSSVKLDVAVRPAKILLATGGVTRRLNGPMSAHGGVELEPIRGYALRAGYKTDNTKGLSGNIGFTAGAGLAILGHELSYAWVPFGDLGDTHYVSLLFNFGSERGADSHYVPPPPAPESMERPTFDRQDWP